MQVFEKYDPTMRPFYFFSRRLPGRISPVLRLVIALAINAAALWVANRLFDGVRIHGWEAYLIAAVVLAIVNAVVRPVVKLLTFPLVILTLGLFVLVINIAMVALTAWITPNFSVDGFGAYLGTVVVLWLVNWAGHEIADRAR
jgi:putative membrane protein